MDWSLLLFIIFAINVANLLIKTLDTFNIFSFFNRLKPSFTFAAFEVNFISENFVQILKLMFAFCVFFEKLLINFLDLLVKRNFIKKLHYGLIKFIVDEIRLIERPSEILLKGKHKKVPFQLYLSEKIIQNTF